jgi:hypothetical protein
MAAGRHGCKQGGREAARWVLDGTTLDGWGEQTNKPLTNAQAVVSAPIFIGDYDTITLFLRLPACVSGESIDIYLETTPNTSASGVEGTVDWHPHRWDAAPSGFTVNGDGSLRWTNSATSHTLPDIQLFNLCHEALRVTVIRSGGISNTTLKARYMRGS